MIVENYSTAVICANNLQYLFLYCLIAINN